MNAFSACPCLKTSVLSFVSFGQFGGLMRQVQEVVLVEIKDVQVQHAANVQIILEQIAPSAILTVLFAEIPDKS